MKELQWFESWFSSPYYHILYKKRDPEEAKYFMKNILHFLHPQTGARILDMACGAGRHAIFLAKQGYDVTGIDLAAESIAKARKKEHEMLHFHVHDMRKPFEVSYFDYVFNLFTSFGYFEDRQDNLNTVLAMAENLKTGGKVLIDFLNPCNAIDALVPNERKTIKGIEFIIRKKFENGLIIKDIDFEDNGEHFHFQEKVQMLERSDFIGYFDKSGLELIHTFGNYSLEGYEECDSERLILIAKKK